jgi:HAD superfamily hydrolase (TIGR01509 family)
VKAVFFDVGETLLDESRAWTGWADWLGVSALTMLGLLGATIGRGEHHLRAFELVRPAFDLDAERRARAAAGVPDDLRPEDLYPDALPCLDALRERGYVVGVAGNTSAETEVFLRAHCGEALIASSAGLGAAKPSQEFFAAIARLAGLAPAEIAYVGDRVDNDVLPALRAGMVAVHIRRGPWGRLQAREPDAARATLRIDSLAELPGALAATSA